MPIGVIMMPRDNFWACSSSHVLYVRYVCMYVDLLIDEYTMGNNKVKTCHILHIQAIAQISSGYWLPPPPGCPRAIYDIMIQCW